MAPYVPLLRRRREGTTDYRSRKRVISTTKPLLVVRFSNRNVSSQFLKPTPKGDKVVSSANSKELVKLGWRGSSKSTPACYLLGMVAGKKAKEAGVTEAVLYTGLIPFVKGGRVAAFVKGVIEAGVGVPAREEVFPPEERLTGSVTAKYAAALAKEQKDQYEREFSGLLKANFRPEDYPKEFEKVRTAVLGAKS